ncbi:MAG: hypothetical protein QOI55_2495 [Actinomycetota bacterium]|nr:hypothetical protein [Actinomycetota bacterium]
MRLFFTELRRFSARRAVRWLVVVALLVIALGTLIAAINSKEKTVQHFVTVCPGVGPQQTTPLECTAPGTFVQDNRFHLHDQLGDAIGGTGVAMLLLGVLFGTTFIGADYAGGALPGQLTFEPRRTYMYATKAVVVAVATAVLTIFLLLVLSAALAGVAQWRGVVGHLDASWYVHRLADIGRVAAVCGGTAAIGFAVTTLARRSVAAVVGFLALGFIVEPALTAALNLFDGKTPMFNLVAVAINDFRDAPEGITSLAKSTAVAGIWTAGLLLLGGTVFARREVR